MSDVCNEMDADEVQRQGKVLQSTRQMREGGGQRGTEQKAPPHRVLRPEPLRTPGQTQQTEAPLENKSERFV